MPQKLCAVSSTEKRTLTCTSNVPPFATLLWLILLFYIIKWNTSLYNEIYEWQVWLFQLMNRMDIFPLRKYQSYSGISVVSFRFASSIFIFRIAPFLNNRFLNLPWILFWSWTNFYWSINTFFIWFQFGDKFGDKITRSLGIEIASFFRHLKWNTYLREIIFNSTSLMH